MRLWRQKPDRVAPLDKQTIPRLELLANLTASRLVKSVSQTL